MTIKNLKKQQKQLDDKPVKCPKCKKTTDWGFLRGFDSCEKCFEKEFKAQEDRYKKIYEENNKSDL